MFPTHSGLSKSIWFGLDELGWFGFSYLFGHLGNFSDFRCGKGQTFLTQEVLDNYPFTLDNLRQMSGKINPILYGCSGGNGSQFQFGNFENRVGGLYYSKISQFPLFDSVVCNIAFIRNV